MITISIFYLLMLLCLTTADSQDIAQDVIYLGDHIDSNEMVDAGYYKEYLEIIREYTDLSSPSNWNFIAQNNPYLKKYFNPTAAVQGSNSFYKLNQSPVSPSSPFLSNIIGGLVYYLSNRVKEELKTEFFNSYANGIKNNRQLEYLMSNTQRVLSEFGDRAYDYKDYFSSFQLALRHDFEVLPKSLSNYIDDEGDNLGFKVGEKFLVSDFLFSTQQIVDTASIFEISDTLAQRSKLHLSSTNRAESADIWQSRHIIVFVNILLNALADNGENRNFVTLSNLDKIVSDPIKTELFLGLLYQKLKTDKLQIGDKYIYELMIEKFPPDSVPSQMSILQSLRSILSEGKNLDRIVGELKSTTDDTYNSTSRTILHYEFIDALESIIQSTGLIAYNWKGDEIGKEKYSRTVEIFATVAKLPVDIKRKEFLRAIVHGDEIMAYVLEDTDKSIFKTAKKIFSISSAFAVASNSEEVQSVFEHYFLPVGSYKDKRADKYNIALNSYIGPLFGYNDINNNSDNELFGLGITAPIGVSLSWSGKERKRSGSIFPFLLDLGAGVSYRLIDGDLSNQSEISFEDVISPGLQFSYGLKRLISINAGLQWTPYLDSVLEGSLLRNDIRKLRYGVGVLVDMPLLTISRTPGN